MKHIVLWSTFVAVLLLQACLSEGVAGTKAEEEKKQESFDWTAKDTASVSEKSWLQKDSTSQESEEILSCHIEESGYCVEVPVLQLTEKCSGVSGNSCSKANAKSICHTENNGVSVIVYFYKQAIDCSELNSEENESSEEASSQIDLSSLAVSSSVLISSSTLILSSSVASSGVASSSDSE